MFPPLSGEMGAQHSGCTDDTSVTATVEELMDNASIYWLLWEDSRMQWWKWD